LVVVELVRLIRIPFFKIKIYKNNGCVSVTHAAHDIVGVEAPNRMD